MKALISGAPSWKELPHDLLLSEGACLSLENGAPHHHAWPSSLLLTSLFFHLFYFLGHWTLCSQRVSLHAISSACYPSIWKVQGPWNLSCISVPTKNQFITLWMSTSPPTYWVPVEMVYVNTHTQTHVANAFSIIAFLSLLLKLWHLVKPQRILDWAIYIFILLVQRPMIRKPNASVVKYICSLLKRVQTCPIPSLLRAQDFALQKTNNCVSWGLITTLISLTDKNASVSNTYRAESMFHRAMAIIIFLKSIYNHL